MRGDAGVADRHRGIEVAQRDRQAAVGEQALDVVQPLRAALDLDEPAERAALDPLGREPIRIGLGGDQRERGGRVATRGAGRVTRGELIPYTERGIQGHSEGYSNPPERKVRAVLLHCGERAESGGENDILDHEIAYIQLRDRDPRHARKCTRPQPMVVM